jgi:opacity protein-like surface antigen
MKRFILLPCLLLALLHPAGAAAQETAVGVKGGLNIASLELDAAGFDVSPDSRPGFVAGVFVRHDLRDRFGVQVEGLYTQKGAKLDEFGVDIDLRIDYLEIPVLARVGIQASDEASVHFVAGPAFAFKVHDTLEVEDIGFGFDDIAMKSWDAGIAIGGGVTFRNLVVDVRYTIGLVNINDDDVAEDLLDVKNRALSFTVGWLLR